MKGEPHSTGYFRPGHVLTVVKCKNIKFVKCYNVLGGTGLEIVLESWKGEKCRYCSHKSGLS